MFSIKTQVISCCSSVPVDAVKQGVELLEPVGVDGGAFSSTSWCSTMMDSLEDKSFPRALPSGMILVNVDSLLSLVST